MNTIRRNTILHFWLKFGILGISLAFLAEAQHFRLEFIVFGLSLAFLLARDTSQAGRVGYSPDFPSHPGDPDSTPSWGNQHQKILKKDKKEKRKTT